MGQNGVGMENFYTFLTSFNFFRVVDENKFK